MNHLHTNRFQDFFEDPQYVILKNYLYNYLLRKRAIEKSLESERPELILELGSGISPIVTHTHRIVYSELSLTALQTLKNIHRKGWHVVADGASLPFKSEVFSHTICSEVLEHLADDQAALKELSRVMKPKGRLVVTFPHRKFYFTNDDRFVKHFRRYELSEMEDRLKEAGLKSILTQKVLGPLEKVTMSFTVFCFSLIQNFSSRRKRESKPHKLIHSFASFFKWANRFYMYFVWLDAKIMPRALSSVLLIKAEKNYEARS